jgi:NAD+ synthase (glutamine-hydrolysing)
MGTENSSQETKDRAQRLAQSLGAHHLSFQVDGILKSILSLVSVVLGKVPQFSCFGGSRTENLALQNIQARLRMVLAYLFAQLLPWARGSSQGTGGGYLLVLGTSNVDEW